MLFDMQLFLNLNPEFKIWVTVYSYAYRAAIDETVFINTRKYLWTSTHARWSDWTSFTVVCRERERLESCLGESLTVDTEWELTIELEVRKSAMKSEWVK